VQNENKIHNFFLSMFGAVSNLKPLAGRKGADVNNL